MPTFAFNDVCQDVFRHRNSASHHRYSLVYYLLTEMTQKFDRLLCCLAESPFTGRILQNHQMTTFATVTVSVCDVLYTE